MATVGTSCAYMKYLLRFAMKNISLNRKKYSLVGRINFRLNVSLASGLFKCNIEPERTNQRELEATDIAFISLLLENSNCWLSNSISS